MLVDYASEIVQGLHVQAIRRIGRYERIEVKRSLFRLRGTTFNVFH